MIKHILVTALLLVLLSGCSLFVKTDAAKEELLLQHLQTWRNFHLEGIAEITINQFRLRKNVHVNRTEEFLNITLFDSGIFGLRPTPFLKVNIDSKFSLSLPDNIIEMISGLPEEDDIDIDMINTLIDELESNRREIVMNGKLTIKDTEIAFTQEMKIDRIQVNDDEDEIVLEFDYRRNDLSKIVFFLNSNRLLEISVDTISYLALMNREVVSL